MNGGAYRTTQEDISFVLDVEGALYNNAFMHALLLYFDQQQRSSAKCILVHIRICIIGNAFGHQRLSLHQQLTLQQQFQANYQSIPNLQLLRRLS